MRTPSSVQPIVESPSRLSVFCARMTEACWLTAVALVPVAYDPSVAYVFEPAKSAILRTLGLLVAAALLVWGAEAITHRQAVKANPAPSGWRGWFAAGALLLVSLLVPTFFSVDPGPSVWGLTGTMQGAMTLLSQFFLGLGVAIFLRTHAQLDRLITVALATSAPVALYGILQRLGLNPLFGVFADYEGKAHSFAGHPIFLAGYLLMLLPLSLHRLWSVVKMPDPEAGNHRGVSVAYYAMLVALQAGGFMAADKRGPYVALAVMLAAALILLAARTRQFRLAQWGTAIAVFFGLLLLSLAALKKTGALKESTPILGTLSKIIPLSREVGDGTGDVYRKLMWEKAPGLVLGATPYVFPNGTPDRLQLLRPLVGYGPETLQGVMAQSWPFAGDGPGVSRIEHRFHNFFWDTWQSSGLLGLGALLFLHWCVFWRGYESAGLLPGTKTRSVGLIATSAAAGLLGGALMAAAYGAGYFGTGFQLGFAGGLIFWPLWRSWCRPSPDAPRRNLADDVLIMALLVALVGHWVDMAFVFPAGNTSALFWIFAGAIAGKSLHLESSASSVRRTQKSAQAEPMPWVAVALPAGLLAGAILIALVHGALQGASETKVGPWDVLRAWLASSSSRPGFGERLTGFLLASWLLVNAGLVLGLPFHRAGERSKAFRLAGGISLLFGLGYALLKAQLMANLEPLPSVHGPASNAVALALGTGAISVGFLALAVAGICALAGALFYQSGERHFAPATWVGKGAAVMASIAAGAAIWITAASVLRSGACAGLAARFEEEGRESSAIAVYEGSLQIFPFGSWERNRCANLIAELGEQEKDAGKVSAAMSRAVALLDEGRKLTELNAVDLHLGQTYLRWALHTPEPSQRRALLLQADQALQRATTFSPQTEAAWFEGSIVDRELGDLGSATEKLARADRVGQNIDPRLWADLYGVRSTTSGAPALKQAFARRGLAYIARALEAETESLSKANAGLPEIRRKTYPLLLKQGAFHFDLGESEMALKLLLQATEAGPGINPWEAEAILAHTYANLSRWPEAFASMENALRHCPGESRERMMALKGLLQQRKLSGQTTP